MRGTYRYYLWLGVTDAKGRIVAATDPASLGKDRSDRDWFQIVRDRRLVHIRDAQASEGAGGAIAVAFTAPIEGTNGEFLGAVTSRVTLHSLEDVLAQTVHALQVQRGFASKIEYQFLNRNGDVIADSLLRQEGTTNLKTLGLPSALLTGSAQPGYIEETHLRRHVRVISGYAQTEQSGDYLGLHWGVLVRMDRSDIVAPIQQVLWKLGAAGVVVFAPMLAFLFWTTGRLRREWAVAQKETAHAIAAERELTARNRELEQTLLEVKVLRGFIPICSSCKKIRNDGGYWQQIESYIQQHSEALFSHGVCPDCYQKLYAEYPLEEEKNPRA
jgi:hypothetical protein